MAKTFFLALTTTPLAVVVQTPCTRVTVKEDEAVTGWPTVNLQISKPTSSDNLMTLTAGKSYVFEKPQNGTGFSPGQTIGYISTASGTTTGMQDEE